MNALLRRHLAVLVVLALSSASCVIPSASSALVTDDDRVCTDSSECVIIETECPCASSGAQVAVNADAVGAIDRRRDQRVCQTEVSDDPSCEATRAQCVEGTCELIGP